MNTVDPLAFADIEHAFRHLEFALRLLRYVELDLIDREEFDVDMTLLLERENVRFPAKTFQTLDSIVLAAQANVGVSFGATAIVLDAAFEAVGMRPQAHGNCEDDLLRTLVYMVRSAFAHNPAMPLWKVKGPYLRTLVLQLEGQTICVPLEQLHGSPFDYGHIGGLANWYRIRRAVEGRVSGA